MELALNTAIVVLAKQRCTVSIALSATELDENRLACNISCSPRLMKSGSLIDVDRLGYLLGTGLAMARRRLSLTAGLRIDVTEVSGSIKSDDDDQGIVLATGLAIARCLGRDDSELAEVTNDWKLAENVDRSQEYGDDGKQG